MADFDTIQTQDFAQRDRFKRVSQRDVLPAAIKSSKLQGFIFGSSTASASVALGNGDGANITFSLSQNSDYELLGNNYISLYVGSVSAANLLFPNEGSGQDITAWQISGPSFDWHTWNSNSFKAWEEYQTINIQNVSAGSVTVLIRGKFKYLSPREGAS